MTSATLASVIDGVIALAIIAAITVLLALHDLTEATAISLYGVAVVLVGGSAKSLLALSVPAPAKPQQAPLPQQQTGV